MAEQKNTEVQQPVEPSFWRGMSVGLMIALMMLLLGLVLGKVLV